MSDEAAFLKAIGDNPADETVRLVYADWLADHDDPRTAFARLSADFLRCVRGLADLRRAVPTEWLEVMDPLFNRLDVLRFTNPGEGIEGGTVTALFVAPGEVVAVGQSLVEISTDKASIEITAERAGAIISLNVRPGDRILVGHPMLTYLSPQATRPPAAPTPVPPTPPPPPTPSVPREPLQAFIQVLEERRETFRAASPAQINEMIGRQVTAAMMVFGGNAVGGAQTTAELNRGWTGIAMRLETRIRNAGLSDELMVQERIDIHIEMLRVLLAKYGQPDRFRELPDAPPASE